VFVKSPPAKAETPIEKAVISVNSFFIY